MFSVQALIGITIDQSDVFLLHVNEVVYSADDGANEDAVTEEERSTVTSRGDCIFRKDRNVRKNKDNKRRNEESVYNNCDELFAINKQDGDGECAPYREGAPGRLVSAEDYDISNETHLRSSTVKCESEQDTLDFAPSVCMFDASAPDLSYPVCATLSSGRVPSAAQTVQSSPRTAIKHRSHRSTSSSKRGYAHKRGFHNSKRFRSFDLPRNNFSKVNTLAVSADHSSNVQSYSLIFEDHGGSLTYTSEAKERCDGGQSGRDVPRKIKQEAFDGGDSEDTETYKVNVSRNNSATENESYFHVGEEEGPYSVSARSRFREDSVRGRVSVSAILIFYIPLGFEVVISVREKRNSESFGSSFVSDFFSQLF